MTDEEFKNIFSRQIDLFSKNRVRAKRRKKLKTSDIILFRMDLIGDCVMFTSAAKAIREFYQNRKMTILCLKISKPVFERLGIFDKIITVDFRPENIDWEKLQKLIEELQNYKFDILLQAQVSKFPVADILAAAVKCNKRVAIETKSGNSPQEWIDFVNKSCLYDEFISYPRGLKSEFDYYAAFVRGIVGSEYKISKPALNYKKQHFIKRKYFVLYVGASLAQKIWEPYKFAKVADYVFERTDFLAVMLGVESEKKYSNLVFMNVKSKNENRIVDLVGKTSLEQVIDIIGCAQFIVSNDTSGVHIACATNTPCVAICGGWHFDRFLPYHIEKLEKADLLPMTAFTKMPCYGCDWQWPIVGKRNAACLENLKIGELSICIQKVSVEQVTALLEKILQCSKEQKVR